MAQDSGIVTGTVQWFAADKGYGFVTPDDGGPDVFVHVSQVEGGRALTEGERVEMALREGQRGPQGEAVRSLDAPVEHWPADDAAVEEVVLQGTVSWFSPDKGFGFLVPDDLFVHGSAVSRAGGRLDEGERVEFVVRRGERGPQAEQVRPLGPGAPAPRRQREPDRAPHRPRAAAGPTTGTVRWFDVTRGFGFVAPDDEGPDVFVHVSSVEGGGGTAVLLEGDRVELTVQEGPRGPQATSVRVRE